MNSVVTRKAVGTPISLPVSSMAVPPEFPWVIAASVFMKARLPAPPCSPCQPETSPRVTWMVLPPTLGYPSTQTCSPGRMSSERPIGTAGQEPGRQGSPARSNSHFRSARSSSGLSRECDGATGTDHFRFSICGPKATDNEHVVETRMFGVFEYVIVGENGAISGDDGPGPTGRRNQLLMDDIDRHDHDHRRHRSGDEFFAIAGTPGEGGGA